MNATSANLPEGAEILEASGKQGTGNVLLSFPAEGQKAPRVLKLYRTRRSRVREGLRHFAQLYLEGKRGATPQARCTTERLSIDTWRAAACDVVHYEDQPLPAGVSVPATWLQFCDGPILGEHLTADDEPLDGKVALVANLATSMSARHDKAMTYQQPLLVHEHGNIHHYFVQDITLVAFDMENGFKNGFSVLEAIAQEIASTLRSIARAPTTHADELFTAFIEHYTDRERLHGAAHSATRGGGLSARLRRWHDQRTRPGKSKTAVMQRALDVLTDT